MKFTFVTTLLAFAAGVGLVAIAHRLVMVDAESTANAMPSWSSILPSGPFESAQHVPDTAAYRAIEPAHLVTPLTVEVELTGHNDQWHIRYQCEGNQQHQEVKVLHLPVNAKVRLKLRSRDFVYMLSLPQINKSQAAVPGLDFILEFQPLSHGTFTLQGNHFCGPPRPTLSISALVESETDFNTWLDQQKHAVEQPLER